MRDGILNINKPQEMTSFDVVAVLRKKLGIRRIGHLGTLDPMAEGVLPVAIGKATRIMDYLNADMKEYIAEIVFGIATDTDDIWGKPIMNSVESHDVEIPEIGIDELKAAIEKQIGIIDQIPPKYSAIKVDGKKLYEYARARQDVHIKSRKVFIPKIEIVNFGKKEFKNLGGEFCYAVLGITCSKGTYIRSIARDLGELLGTHAVMSSLIRNRSGAFGIGDSVNLEDMISMSIDDIEKLIKGADYALASFPSAMLGEWESSLFKKGVPLRPEQWKKFGYINENMQERVSLKNFPLELPEKYMRAYKVFSENGFLGIGLKETDGSLKTEKVLI